MHKRESVGRKCKSVCTRALACMRALVSERAVECVR